MPPAEQFQLPRFASLVLTLDARGEASIYFFLVDFAHPLDKERATRVCRQCLEDTLEEISQEEELLDIGPFTCNFRCRGAFQRDRLIVRGRFDLNPLWSLLRDHNVEKLSISISHPQGRFSECTLPVENRKDLTRIRERMQEQLDVFASREKKRSIFSFFISRRRLPDWGVPDFARYDIPVGPEDPPLFELAYGYRVWDLYPIGVLAVLLVLPPVALLWKRRQVLSSHVVDPTTAWFGYWQFHRRILIAAFLAWLLAVFAFPTRSWLEQYFRFIFNRPETGIREHSPYDLLAVTLYLIPPGLVGVLCVGLSYPVMSRVRGADWTRGELIRQSLWGQFASLVPFILLAAGVGALEVQQPRLTVLWFAGAFVSRKIGLRMRAQSFGVNPWVLDVGELRDRIFALADKAAVKLRQVYVMPATKGREANAAAAVGNMVILNDYLIRHLRKSEVDAVVAHELAHLRQQHLRKTGTWTILLIPVLVASLVFLDPTILRWIGIRSQGLMVETLFRSVPILVACIILLILMARRRKFERHADAGAVELTGDAEAMITALAKLARLSLMPLEWSRWEERLLTHPAMSRRIRAIAAQDELPPGRVEEILATQDNENDRYSLPAAFDKADLVFSGSFKRSFAFRYLWTSHLLATLPPASVAALVTWAGIGEINQRLTYLAGLGGTIILSVVLWDWLVFRSFGRLHPLLRAKLERQGILPDTWGGILVGFAPGSVPRLYEGSYDWDRGFLFLFEGCLCFVGEKACFSLRQDQVRSVSLGLGSPAWLSARRIYLAWRDEERCREGVFSLQVGEGRSRLQLRKFVSRLHRRTQKWRKKHPRLHDRPEALANLDSPEIGTVTGLSPSLAAKPSMFFRILFPRLLLAIGFGVLFGLPFSFQDGAAGWYAPAVATFLTIFDTAPYWFYREPLPIIASLNPISRNRPLLGGDWGH